MKFAEVKKLLNANLLTGEEHLEEEILSAYSCDLMSDVLRYANEGSVLLTGLVNNQVINTIDMANMVGIIFVRGKLPGKDLIEMAKDIDRIILTTDYSLFETSGILFQNGMKGAHTI
ncbi:MAG: hypothetical protein ACRCU3_02015 [Eubacteriaceae bacterium]